MKLIFAYVRSFKNIHEQEFAFSDDYDVSFEGNRLSIRKTDMNQVKDVIYGGNLIKDMHIIVGRTGAGKTNLLQMIGMEFQERFNSQNSDAYFLLYKCSDEEDLFAVEVLNMYIPQINIVMRLRHRKEQTLTGIDFYRFHYNFKTGVVSGIDVIDKEMFEDTTIVNTFDRNAFARYPYHDTVEQKRSRWLPRKVTPYAETSPGKVVNAAREYIEQMPKGSIKRKAAFIVNRENWQYKLNVELDKDLLEKEYWLYGKRRQGGFVTSLSDVPYASIDARLPKGRKNKKVSAKEMFIHDLLTDYAIYLRKVASSVEALGRQLPVSRPLQELDESDPRVLPDGRLDLTLEQRISWLGQYIDYHTDGYYGNKGLVWQETIEICDVADIMRQFDDRFFTPDQFKYPVVDISEDDKRFYDLFEMMGQYHRDQFEVFPKEFLPYELSYLSSGEFQYAKIWGAIEEAIDTKLALDYKKGIPEELREQQLIVLMDEPETYLHPEYCREFIFRTVKVLEKRNPGLQLQLIITTHSPFMLSDTISSQVTRIDYDDDGECVVYEDSEKQFFAANLFSIMADGFFLDYTIGEYSRTFLTEKFSFLKGLLEKGQDITQQEMDEVDRIESVLPYIGDDMIRHCFKSVIALIR